MSHMCKAKGDMTITFTQILIKNVFITLNGAINDLMIDDIMLDIIYNVTALTKVKDSNLPKNEKVDSFTVKSSSTSQRWYLKEMLLKRVKPRRPFPTEL